MMYKKAVHAVTAYAEKVLNTVYGQQCGKYEIEACRRHLNDLEKSPKPDYPYIFDETRADRIINHLEKLPRQDVEGELIVLEDWQKFDFGCMFGWVRKRTGKRRFKRGYIRIARGHAKTTAAAGIGLYFMTGDAIYPPGKPELAKYELNPEINIVAVDKVQGRKAREDMAGMAEACPAMAKRLDIKKSYIRHKTRGGEINLFSRDKNNKDGGRPSLVITEEWHAHVDSTCHEVAVSAMGKKRQCLELIITTAGKDAENKPCYKDDLQYKRVLDGEAEQDDVFIMIREIDDEDDPHDKSCWCKSNPFFRGNSDYAQTLLDEVESAYADAYGNNNYFKIREFLIKRMNRWQADAENKYASGWIDKFKSKCMPREQFRELTSATHGNYGFDLGKTRDLSGSAYVTVLKDGRIAIAVHGFMPQNRAIEHEHSDRIPYIDWAKDGYVTLTPGDVTDNRHVEKWIYDCERERKWKHDETDYDGYNATDLAIRLSEKYGDDKVVEIPQTCFGQNQATKRFRELVLDSEDKIVCEYSPLFIWCLSNAIEISDNYGNIKLNKKHKEDTQRIDPVAAMMNALARIIVKIDSGGGVSERIKSRGYALS